MTFAQHEPESQVPVPVSPEPDSPEPDSPEPDSPEPDSKDWTFVIEQQCPECLLDPIDPPAIGPLLRASIPSWRAVLLRDDVAVRPEPHTWSPLEYACHVRDVCQVFLGRLTAMVSSNDPAGVRFENWDQDQAAIQGRYWEANPLLVGNQYSQAATTLADAFDRVTASEWHKVGLRSNGSRFTVATLAIYLWHDIAHHLHDVRPNGNSKTGDWASRAE